MSKIDKIEKEMPEFTSEVRGLNVQELEARLVNLTKASEANQDAMEADEGLEQAKDQVREFSAPYRDFHKHNRMKTQYILNLLKERE